MPPLRGRPARGPTVDAAGGDRSATAAELRAPEGSCVGTAMASNARGLAGDAAGPTGRIGPARRHRPAGPDRPDAAGDVRRTLDQFGDDRRGDGDIPFIDSAGSGGVLS